MRDLRCSAIAREQRLDPIGTAGSYAGYLLVAHPLPWPRDIGDADALAAVATEAKTRGWRLQGLVPRQDNSSVVFRYERPPGAFAGYDSAVSDRLVLICTHGARDACCGSLGSALHRSIPGLGPGVQLWRTSHTGGHRFAPTAIVLPEGTLWAYLDAELLTGIVHRTAPVDDVLPHYRGCAGLAGPEVQAADREGLRRQGWSWLDTPRAGEVIARDDQGRVHVQVTGAGVTYQAVVVVARMVPVADCGKPLEQAKKVEAEYRVVSVNQP
jgi:hypothetical protein